MKCARSGESCHYKECCSGFVCRHNPRGPDTCITKPTFVAIMDWVKISGAHEINFDHQDLPSSCNANDYKVALNSFVDHASHFFLSAIASDENGEWDEDEDINCPKALAFASINGKKVIYSVPDVQDILIGFNSHFLGKATLGDIVEAERSAEAVDDADYDLTKNSCAHYGQKIYRALKLEETQALADFVTSNLLKDDGIVKYAKKKTEQGGLRVLLKYALNDGMFQKYVKDTVVSQLDIKN